MHSCGTAPFLLVHFIIIDSLAIADVPVILGAYLLMPCGWLLVAAGIGRAVVGGWWWVAGGLPAGTKLKILFILGARKMVEVPRVLGKMTQLTRLGLKSNGIARIADDALYVEGQFKSEVHAAVFSVD